MKIHHEPRKLWIGVSWTKIRTTTLDMDYEQYVFDLCIVPCFPIVFTITRQIPKHKRHKNW